jgi:hypothetical protein
MWIRGFVGFPDHQEGIKCKASDIPRGMRRTRQYAAVTRDVRVTPLVRPRLGGEMMPW